MSVPAAMRSAEPTARRARLAEDQRTALTFFRCFRCDYFGVTFELLPGVPGGGITGMLCIASGGGVLVIPGSTSGGRMTPLDLSEPIVPVDAPPDAPP
jgi:hypothetical protein